MNIQTTVHLLPLPFELAETINGFLFRSYKSIQQEIIQKIKLGFSRATLTQYYLTESDFDNDHWFFPSVWRKRMSISSNKLLCMW